MLLHMVTGSSSVDVGIVPATMDPTAAAEDRNENVNKCSKTFTPIFLAIPPKKIYVGIILVRRIIRLKFVNFKYSAANFST